ncbi:TIGR02281 family clan AA aspartic protease [Comamonas sp. GB3 AK4-5]|uniref:retropepsin-like aspartic protease family protein n=1 Tax=Comamonas sp. GB3 AK4-5 TaxID=3231487 RepID=UPI00351F4706
MNARSTLWRTQLAMALFWLAALGALYLAMDRWLQPAAVTVQADGSLQLSRHRDGHFYADGSINGQPVRFLVDTGATAIAVTDALAEAAGLQGGREATFSTANGERPGRLVRADTVSVGPLTVRRLTVGTGYTGDTPQSALLGQNFLKQFEVRMAGDVMVIRSP